MDITRLVKEFRRAKPNATNVEAEGYAREVCETQGQVDDFVQLWFQAKVKEAVFKQSVDRIWSEEKGY